MKATSAIAVPEQTSATQGSETPAPKRARRVRARGQRGSIYKRGKSWCIVYRTAERRQKVETLATKDLAQARLTEAIQQIRDGKFPDFKPQLFSTFTKNWLERRQSSLKPGVWRTYKSALKQWLTPEFGDYELAEISRPMVKQFAHKLLAKNLKGKSVKCLLILLHGIFTEAIDDEVCASNPVHRLVRKMSKSHEIPNDSEDRVVPTKNDLLATLRALGDNPVYQALLCAAALTGCRRGELCGLLWREIDWLGHSIRIERSLVRIAKSKAGSSKGLEWICSSAFALASPKSEKGRRVIVMVPELEQLLKQLWAMSDEKNLFIFQSPSGPLALDKIAGVLHAAQKKAGVTPFGLHGVRHFFASCVHEKGATLAQARDLLGHSDAAMTAKYTHVLQSGREHVEAIGRDFGSAITLTRRPQ